jgi:ubiquinone/menaquinone biosynthesis C-methylase UbiE
VSDTLDWGDGNYALTAEALLPAADVLVEAAAVGAGDDVLDVACGTGHVALAAARRGAKVGGVDSAAALVALATERVPDGRFLVGEAESLPVESGAFDAALSAFGVIFSPDPPRAASELLRAVRPGGRVAITTWAPEGTIHRAGGLLAAEVLPPREDPPRWGDSAWVEQLFERAGAATVDVREEQLAFTDASPDAWFDAQVENHPVWRFGRRRLDDERWTDLRERSIVLLADGNEDPSAFRTTSRYLVVVAASHGG